MSIPKETVVMGNQPDGLLKMEKFDGNETKIIWPAWKLDLDRRITFEFGAPASVDVAVDGIDADFAELERHASL